jgi:hypothetical protein
VIPSFIAWAFALTLLAQPIGDPPGFNHPEFICYTEESGRFLALLRHGNSPDLTGNITGPERNGHLIVFEYLGKDKPLRKLYEATLITKGVVSGELSRDGRFFVTLDDMQSSGIRPHTVVIYDLARKERTAYAGKDFMNEELIKSLPIPGRAIAPQ